MCGICGIVGPSDRSMLKNMLSLLSHRGPDDCGVFIDDNASLGTRRLNIVDLSTGKQPILNEDGSLCLVFNGEIYNFRGLRQNLASTHRFSSSTDGEVIVHLYEDFGTDCVKFLEGMFAFAIWDSKARRLMMARDPFGIKPMYYHSGDEGALVFASEVKAILSYYPNPCVSSSAIADLLLFHFVPHPRTMFEGIWKLPPGHFLTWEKGGATKLVRYWTPEFRPNHASETMAASTIRRMLESSVHQCLAADVPVGISLSGGVDSASLVSLASDLHKGIQTFTFGFSEDDSAILQSRRIANTFQTKHVEVFADASRIAKEIGEVVWHLDEPILSTAIFPTYFLSKGMKGRTKCVLVGEGSDEIFAGYLRYKLLQKLQRVLDLGGANAEQNRVSLDSLDYSVRGNLYRTWSVANRALKKKIDPVAQQDPIRVLKGSNGSTGLVERAQLFDITYDLPDFQLLRVDKLMMANGIEARVPFLRTDLMAFSVGLPVNYKISGSVEKWILRKAMEDTLPDQPGKSPLRTPLGAFQSSEFLSEMTAQIKGCELARQYFNSEWLDHVMGNPRSENLTFLYLSLVCTWYEAFIERFPDISVSQETNQISASN